MINTKWTIKERTVMNDDGELIAASFVDDSKDEGRILDAIANQLITHTMTHLGTTTNMKAKELRQKYMFGGYGALSDTELKRLAAIEPNKFEDITAEYTRRKAERGEYITLKKITRSHDAYGVLQPFYEGLEVEHFYAAYLNRANKVIGVRLIGIGGISGTVCDVRVLLKYGIELGASGIILSHNHPSGNTQPSEADRVLTRRMIEAGKVMDIQIMEHIIIAGNSYLSFADEGLM